MKEQQCHPTQSTISYNLSMEVTYFAIEGKLYEQIEGDPMGSPLSPVIADIYMEFFESTAIRTASLQSSLWLQYIDDTLLSSGPMEFNLYNNLYPISTHCDQTLISQWRQRTMANYHFRCTGINRKHNPHNIGAQKTHSH